MPNRISYRRAPFRSLHRTMLLALVLVGAAVIVGGVGTVVQRDRLADAQHELRDTLRPAQRTTDALLRTYVDQESGQRGFLLTGRAEFLQPYEVGRTQAATLQAQLTHLAVSPQVDRLRDAALAAGARWQREVAEPEIAMRRAGRIDTDALLSSTRLGKQLFDGFRAAMNDLSTALTALAAVQLDRFDSAQDDVDRAAVATVALVVVAVVLGLLSLRFLLSLPLRRLVGQVVAVADGNYDTPIDPAGPREAAAMAIAVEHMRVGILEHSRDLAVAREQLSVAAERDRLVADLQEGTIARVSLLAVKLHGLAARHPSAQPELLELVGETDLVLRNLRETIFPRHAESPASISPPSGGTEEAEFSSPSDAGSPAQHG